MAIETFVDGNPATGPAPTPGTVVTALFLRALAIIKDIFSNTVNASVYNGGAFNAATLNAAIAAIGSDGKRLVVKAGTWMIDANVNIPSNIAVEGEKGVGFAVQSGFTLTINRIHSLPTEQIFSGLGTVSIPDTAFPYELAIWRGGGMDLLFKRKIVASANASGKGINIWRGAGPGDTTTPLPGEEGPGWFNQTCVGLESGESFTVGNDNTAFGYRTLKAATTALDCTAVGADCMAAMVDGIGNTAMGWRSMLLMTGGSSNTALGNRAMGEATGGTDNVGLGGRALFSNTSLGIRNVAVGKQAMELNTEGENNVAIGYLSQQASTIQNRNTSIGSRTLEFLVGSAVDDQIGADNTACGWSALQSITTGHTNTAIGLQAGRRLAGGGVAETVNSSCYIGANTNASADGMTNENVFGFGADGMGSNTVVLGNDDIEETFLKGEIRGYRYHSLTDGVDAPGFYIEDSSRDSDERKYFVRSALGEFQIQTQNDDEDDGRFIMRSNRDGIAVLDVRFGNATDNPEYEFRGTGKAIFGGAIELGEDGPQVLTGVGAPSGAAPNGSVFLREDGTGPNLYVRENDSWLAK